LYNGKIYRFAFPLNRDIVIAALESHGGPKTMQEIPIHFRQDVDVLEAAPKTDRVEWECVPAELQQNNPTFAFMGIQKEKNSANDC